MYHLLNAEENVSKFTKFTNGFKNLASSYSEGLFSLVMALIALGLEFLLDDKAFICPRTNYQLYAISFFVVPAVLLLILNLLTFPASGNVSVWTLCESCYIKEYRRKGDFVFGFLSALFIGFVAPTVWMIVSFFNARYLVCWELGYQFNANVTEAYLKERGFDNLTIERYEEKVDHAKAKSHAIGAILLGVSVLFFGLFIILRRSCQKPHKPENRLPALWELERCEALAASNELELRLIYGSDHSEMPFVIKELIMLEQLQVFKDELSALRPEDDGEEGDIEEKGPKDEEKAKEIENEMKEIKGVLDAWNEFVNAARNSYVNEDAQKTIKEKKDAFETKRGQTQTDRGTRMGEAQEKLRDLAKKPAGEDRSEDIAEIQYQTWLINRLQDQKRHFAEFEKLSFLENRKEVHEYLSKLRLEVVPFLEEEFTDCPESRGRFVSRHIMRIAKDEDSPSVPTDQNVLELFEALYPRAATGDPRLRYINVDHDIYRTIIKYSGVVDRGAPLGGQRWHRSGKMKWHRNETE